jgi:hypothetical protein
MPHLQSDGAANLTPLSVMANDPASWSMGISEVLPFLTDDAYATDQWLMLGDFDTGGFSFE